MRKGLVSLITEKLGNYSSPTLHVCGKILIIPGWLKLKVFSSDRCSSRERFPCRRSTFRSPLGREESGGVGLVADKCVHGTSYETRSRGSLELVRRVLYVRQFAGEDGKF